jgi:hypothetical protein
MNQMNIPTNAYIFIGVASLVMAAVTIMDNGESNEPVKTEEGSSFTDMLPSLDSSSDNTDNSRPSSDTNYNPFDMNLNSDAPPSSSQPVVDTNFIDPMFTTQPTQAPQNNDMFSNGLNADMPPPTNEPLLSNPMLNAPVPSAPENNMAFNDKLNSDMPPANEPSLSNPGFINNMANQPQPAQQQPPQQPLIGGKNKTKHNKIEHKKHNKHKKTKRYNSKK